MEANKFPWHHASILAHFENRISKSGNTCSFKLKSITCYPTSEERKIALGKQLNCPHSSSSSWFDIFQHNKYYPKAILTHVLIATISSDSPRNWLLLYSTQTQIDRTPKQFIHTQQTNNKRSNQQFKKQDTITNSYSNSVDSKMRQSWLYNMDFVTLWSVLTPWYLSIIIYIFIT